MFRCQCSFRVSCNIISFLPKDDEGLCVGGERAPLRPLPLPHEVVEVVILKEISQDLN